MAYTEVKRKNYGQQVSNSFADVTLGLIVLVAATAMLWWNEGRAVHTTQDIREVGRKAVHVADISTVDPSLDGQLVHINSRTATADSLSDALFGVKTNAIALRREVEYYQWVESASSSRKEKMGGTVEETTTYTYAKQWTPSPVNSLNFHDPSYQSSNSVICDVKSKILHASDVTLGAYHVPEDMISQFAALNPHDTQLHPTSATLRDIDDQMIQLQTAETQARIQATRKAAKDTTLLFYAHQQGNYIYLGRDASQPEVGDMRVSFVQYDPCDVSFIARIEGDHFSSYTTKNGSSETYLTQGHKTIEEMMQSEEEDNTLFTWVLRVVGLILVILGLKKIFGIFAALLRFIPVLANILNWGVSFICSVIGFAWTLVVIAIAWIWYRPIVGISLLILAAALIYFLTTKRKPA